MREKIKDRLFTIVMMVVVIMGMLLASSCRSTKVVPSVPPTEQIIVRDSTVFHVRDSIVVIPVEQSVNVLVTQEPSHLETSLAVSDAWLDAAGLLHHAISNKAGIRLETHTVKETIYKDSIRYVPEPYPVPEYVPRKLTWWQKTMMTIGKISIIMFVLFVCYVFLQSGKNV